jgi:putative NADH-flavin reductase
MSTTVVFGAAGRIGSRICAAAADIGDRVVAVVRTPGHANINDGGGRRIQVVDGDAREPRSVAKVVAGADAIISAIGIKTADLNDESLAHGAQGLIAGALMTGVNRLLFVGGAGSLEVLPGIQAVDTPDFPTAYKPGALAQRRALQVFRSPLADIDWTYVSPAAEIAPGMCTGTYRIGYEQMLVDDLGVSRISMEDYVVAILDVLRDERYFRKRITVAY